MTSRNCPETDGEPIKSVDRNNSHRQVHQFLLTELISRSLVQSDDNQSFAFFPQRP